MNNRCKGITECNFLKSLFDKIRIVNPISNKVINFSDKGINFEDSNCHEFWGRNDKCENCITMRAFNENRTFIKIECKDDRVYSIAAIPISDESDRYVVECIRDITDSMLIDDVNSKSIDEIYREISRLNKLVITDDLTNCYNRRYINERLPLEIKKAKENKEKLSIAILDIDFFKAVNDKFSHLIGDYVLKQVAEIIDINIRKNYDWIGRYGGEEFLIMFKNLDKENSIQLAELIRSIVEKHKFRYRDIEIDLTVSIGIAELSTDIETMEKLIEEADKNLYRAKALGRNLVIG